MRYQTSWSKSGSLRDRQVSAPLSSFDAAMSLAHEKKPHNRSVTILKEGSGINAGTFYLDFIVK